MSDSELIARLALSSFTEPADERIGRALVAHSPGELVRQLARGRGERAGIGDLQARWDEEDWRALADAELVRAAQLGVDVVIPGDRGWPTQLDDLGTRAPLALRVLGAIPLRQNAARSVAIVGARSATRYGRAVADDLAASLASHGWCVVSGAAFGIDAAAHFGALAVNGATIAVSAAGADCPTPVANSGLFDRIYTTGAVVSEVPLGARPNRSRFLVRNRVIAALTRAVVVVEAAMRSGARSTASQAGHLGRIVAAVPGPVTSAMSMGCHQLIRDQQAVLVSSPEEVLELLAPIQTALPFAEGSAVESRDGGLVMAALRSDESADIDAICARLGMERSRVLAALLLLEQSGAAYRDRDGWRTAVSSGRHAGPS